MSREAYLLTALTAALLWGAFRWRQHQDWAIFALAVVGFLAAFAWMGILPALLIILGAVILFFLGAHMIIAPKFYVGLGPIPAQNAQNVRAMGLVTIVIIGFSTAIFTVPILSYIFSSGVN